MMVFKQIGNMQIEQDEYNTVVSGLVRQLELQRRMTAEKGDALELVRSLNACLQEQVNELRKESGVWRDLAYKREEQISDCHFLALNPHVAAATGDETTATAAKASPEAAIRVLACAFVKRGGRKK
jgi:hypothetical protein